MFLPARCCRRPCQHREEENYFFALSKYQAQLEALLEGSESFVQPASRRNEVLGWVREGACKQAIISVWFALRSKLCAFLQTLIYKR
jgi:methionyl-tRNA synthetase